MELGMNIDKPSFSDRHYLPILHPEIISRRRQDYGVQLRREKRRVNFAKKRGICNNINILSLRPLPLCFSSEDSLSDIEKLVFLQSCLTERKYLTYEVLKYLNEEMAKNGDALIAALANLGFVEVLGQYLNPGEKQEVVRECSKLVCNLASTAHEYTNRILKNGILDLVIPLISKDSTEISENCIWCISNIIGDCEEYWSFVIDKGIISIVSNFTKSLNRVPYALSISLSKLIKNICIYPHNLCDEDYIIILNCICTLLKQGSLIDLIKAFGYLFKVDSVMGYFFDLKLQAHLMACLKLDVEAKRAGLRALGHVMASSDNYVKIIFDEGVLDAYLDAIGTQDRLCIKYSMWGLSGLSDSYISRLISHEVFLNCIYFLLSCYEEVREEASYVLLNVSTQEDWKIPSKIKEIIAFQVVGQAVNFPEPKYLINMLKSIEGLLRDTEFCQFFEESGSPGALKRLEYHADKAIREYTEYILDAYYSEQDIQYF